MHLLTSFLDLLFLSWFFYPLVIVFPVICYYIIEQTGRSVYHDNDWPGGPLFLLAIVGAAVLYRFPTLRPASWHGYIWWALTYIAIGFGVALYKWLAVLVAFKRGHVKIDIARAKAAELAENPQNHARAQLNEAVDRLKRDSDYRRCIITVDGDTGFITIYPNWQQHPIASWFAYWPFHALSIPFDWLTDAVEWVAKALRGFWEGIAKHFSVKG